LRSRDAANSESFLAPMLAAHGSRISEVIAAHRPGAQKFYRAVKQRGEADLRHIVEEYPNIVCRPRPAWISPPMVIPQALPANISADVVILDAVHRLGVEYLLPAIVRGRQVIIAADAQ